MSLNISGLPDTTCFLAFPRTNKSSQAYYTVTLGTCVVNAVFAPMTVAANAFILLAIWKNPSLRTPSYVLLAGLAVTDLGTGLLTQPAYVVATVSELTGNSAENNCLANEIVIGPAYYFSFLTGFVIMLSSVERWLYMSRRSLLTVRRVVTIYIMVALFHLINVAGSMCTWYFWNEYWYEIYAILAYLYFSLAAIVVFITAFAYFKVFQIIRRHQRQIQTNESNLDMRKYEHSIFTILYIFAIFALGYVPILSYGLAAIILKDDEISIEPYSISAALLFSSSIFNPLLYYWRKKEIRDGVRSTIRNLFYKQNEES